jgi:dTDP-glucose pyrophosphorylase
VSQRGWTLLVLAAGMGRRFGGDKQLAPLGPSGELLSDYTLYDAIRAGAGRAVFVVRPDLEAALRAHHRAWQDRIELSYPVQPRPVGTTDAVLVSGDELAGWSVVVNADDFYGRAAIAAAADWIRTADASAGAAAGVIAFRLGDTFSGRGGVSRALLETDGDGWLTSIVERRDLTPDSGLAPELPVSMNCWVLPPGISGLLQEEHEWFRSQPVARAGEELPLPVSIGRLVERGRLRVKVIPAGREWIGVTHADDVPRARAALGELVRRGDYPASLSGSAP